MQRTLFIESHVDHAQLGYGCDERRLKLAADFLNLRQCIDQNARKFFFSKIPGFENELSDVVPDDLGMFNALVADVLVPREQGPPVATHVRQPFVVRCPALKVAQMPLVPHSALSQSLQHGDAIAKIFVEIEDEFPRLRLELLAPTGWLLRFRACFGHTPLRVHVLTRER